MALKLPRPGILPALLLGSASLGAHAIGVGQPRTLSALGQPLQLQFPIRLAVGETLTPDCVRAEVLAGDARLPAQMVQLLLEGEGESTVRAVRLQSLVQVDEPLVTVNLVLGCPPRLTRQYTAFIDPPSTQQVSAPAAPEPTLVRNYSPAMRAALSTAEAKPAVLLAPGASAPELGQAAVLPVEPASAAAAASAPAAKRHRTETTTGQPLAALAPAKPAPRATRAAPAKPAARLQMEPAEVLEAAPPASAPLAAPPPVDPALQQRLAQLEQSLQKMQGEGRNTQDQLAGLRQQLQQAQQARFQNPLVYTLGALVALFAGGCLFFWRSRQVERRMHESAWWDDVRKEQREHATPPLPASRQAPVAPAVPVPAVPAPAVPAPAVPAPAVPAPVVASPEPASWASLQRPDEQTLPLPGLDSLPDEALQPPAGVVLPEPAPEPEHEPISFQLVDPAEQELPASLPPAPVLTVEALIDLEQQIDFFLVLGQEDATIELLQSQLQGGGSGSALLYLKLLQIHQQHGDAAVFQALAQRYAQRFGTSAPSWHEPLGEGAGLPAQPQLLTPLQARWKDSGASMALLQKWLTDPHSASEVGLDLAVHRDLLVLYGVARDLSEQEVRGEEIDLFLPLDGPSAAAAASAGMMATMVWQSHAEAGHSRRHALEVDISLDTEDDEKDPGKS